MDERPDLRGADAPISTGAEDDSVGEDAIPPDGREVFMFLSRHECGGRVRDGEVEGQQGPSDAVSSGVMIERRKSAGGCGLD